MRVKSVNECPGDGQFTDAAIAALQRLGGYATKVVGTILKGWDQKRSPSGYYGDSEAYQRATLPGITRKAKRMPHALVTGGAGFIGSHLTDSLLNDGWQVTVVDDFDSNYSPQIKNENIEAHHEFPGYRLIRVDIRDYKTLTASLDGSYDVIVHLAAKVGVRQSIENPIDYQQVNVLGTQHVLELARTLRVPQFVFASSSSVYGVNRNVPWREDDCGLQPISPYASSKIAGEMMGRVYSYLYGIRFLALRFFTVYGPRQRPDLAIHKFSQLILDRQPIPVYGDGSARRDYTYVGDVVSAIRGAMGYTGSPFEIVNVGNDKPVTVRHLIGLLEEVFEVPAEVVYLAEQPGDVPQTHADISKAARLLGYRCDTPLPVGLRNFALWLRARPDFRKTSCGQLPNRTPSVPSR